MTTPERWSQGAIFLRFLRYGFLAWGGPVAQIALMHRELVERDQWTTEERFRKSLALYQVLPGPEAHELAVWFGTLKGGRLGGFLAGLGFMLPGVVLVTLLAALYVHYAPTMALAAPLLVGIRPAVVALIAVGFIRLGRKSFQNPVHILIASAAALTGILVPTMNVLLILALGGLVALVLQRRPTPPAAGFLPILGWSVPLQLGAGGALGLLMLKVGLLTFGGAYTSIPLLHRGAVLENGWLTEQEFLDGVALTSLVPGPLIALGTFIGFLVGSWQGAAASTLIIFAPAFAFTLIGHRFLQRWVEEPRLHAFLLGVTAAVVGLIAATAWTVGVATLRDAFGLALFFAAGLVLYLRPASTPLVLLAAGGLGIVAHALL